MAILFFVLQPVNRLSSRRWGEEKKRLAREEREGEGEGEGEEVSSFFPILHPPPWSCAFSPTEEPDLQPSFYSIECPV